MTDHSALIERLEAATGFPFGTYAGEAGKPLCLIHSSDLTDAAAALRDQQSKMQMMQARLDRWEPKPDAFSNWLIGRRPLPSAPNQAKEGV